MPEQIQSLKPNCAFRPYVRTTNVQQSDLKGLNDEQKEARKAKDWHSPQRFPTQKNRPPNVYFFPRRSRHHEIRPKADFEG